MSYGTFAEAMAAAVGGAGIALGRTPLIDAELASGRLVRLSPDLSQPASWRLVMRKGPSRHRAMTALIDFLLNEAKTLHRGHPT